MKENDFDIEVTGQYDVIDLQVRINGESIQYVKETNSISFTIPERYRTKGRLEITLFSEGESNESKPQYINIE